MGRTNRRHSYRRSKRWNPNRYQSDEQANAVTRKYVRKGRNPGGMTKYLSDGKIHVSGDGDVTVSDSRGVVSTYRIPYGRVGSFIREVQKSGSRAGIRHYVHDDVLSADWGARQNPGRGHRGHRKGRRGFRSSKKSRPSAFKGLKAKRWSRVRSKGRGHGRRARRNPRIKRREAKAISRVLKRHGYRCAGKRRRKSRRGRR